MLEKFYFAFVAILDKIIWTIDIGPSVHKFFLAPQVGNFRVGLGKIRAARLYRRAVRRVPAYAHFISLFNEVNGPIVKKWSAKLNDVPEMDKDSYIKQYYLTDKLWDGELPTKGVMFDESSGSSGVPTSWVRGARERRFTQRIMQVSFEHFIGKKDPIVINTFSMGAWATGMNTTLCLVGVTRIKSIGPDVTKVVNTLNELGSGYEYVIAGYPPFLKQLTEHPDIDWSSFKIAAIFGGEGISEPMRASLLQYYSDVIGSYGASDLEINIAHENQFTIALRQAIIADENLRNALVKQNRGIIPSVFQYNPYDYLFETNELGELVVTICRIDNLSPRIRYNIHDLGHAEHFYDLRKKLIEYGYQNIVDLAELDFGVLFHYGRSDLSVDYNGAVVGPEEIKQIIASTEEFRAKINNFRLVSYEDKESRKHLLIAVEQDEHNHLAPQQAQELLDYIVQQLMVLNLDFKSAYSTSQLKPEIKVYKCNHGIFDAAHQKLKNDYIWNIDYARAKSEGILE